jgi:hypothetical protein
MAASDIRVIGAGLPRTGTLTQKLALESLGFGPCYHWVDVIADLDRVEQWHRACDGEGPWDEIFDGFVATVDWPGGFFAIELAQRYPEAKVVLSTRDPQKWVESFRETIWDLCYGDVLIRHLSDAREKVDPRWQRYLELIDRMFWVENGTFARAHDSDEDLIAGMRAHEQAVRAAVAPERLLVWEVTEGWGPLCEFLDVPVPAEPLPHANDRETFHDRVTAGAIAALSSWYEARAK